MKAKSPRPTRLKDYRPPSHLIDRVALDIALDPEATRVRARLKVRPNPAAQSPKPARTLVLDGEGLALEAIRLSGRRLGSEAYELTSQALIIHDIPDRAFTLEITSVCNPSANKALSGLYRSRGIYCTQCEAQGFRRLSYFLDRPDVLAVYETRIEAHRDEAPILLSNGNRLARGRLAGGRHFALWHDPHPKPSYLFALVGGDLAVVRDRFVTMSGRRVRLEIYVEPGKEDRCAWAMECLKRAMRWDEEKFGREYDLDTFMIVAVSDFNMGAMENKGLNIFNDKLILASPETATDETYAAIESVIAHEYFHNWTGNRITCRDWFQLCLKEGLTVFRDQEFSADVRSGVVQRIDDVRRLKAHQFPEDAGPLAHPVRPEKYIEINNFYTATVYQKGAELCRMIRTIVGDEGFRKGMDLYFERHDGEATTVEAFIACFEDATGCDLAQFMQWYRQAGTPELVARFTYDPKTREAMLDVEQVLLPTPGQARKRPLHIPLALGLVGPDGRDLPLKLAGGERVPDGVLHLTRRRQSFRFVDVPDRPVPSLLRGFSAPVNLTIDLSDGELLFLMGHDSDLYNRWQAAETLSLRLASRITAAIRAGKQARPSLAYARTLGELLADEALEPAYRARLLTLPSEAEIARHIGRDVDPGANYRARRRLMALVARALYDPLVAAYEAAATPGSYSPDAASAGRRALGAAVLQLLAATGRKAEVARVARHYARARSMTDRTAALGLLVDIKGPERERALADFYRRFKDDHIVIDKWFTFQAISALPETLETVAALTRHELFSIRNPNKVRALVGAFAMSNPLQFHRPDGAGYAFVAERVLEIDRFNPQLAARLLSAFKSWKVLEPVRQRLARQQLRRIARRKTLSRDVYDIVTRMLA